MLDRAQAQSPALRQLQEELSRAKARIAELESRIEQQASSANDGSQALKDTASDLFRGTFEQAAVGIGHTAPNGKWLRVNQRLCEIVGYSEAELRTKTYQDLTHPDDIEDDNRLAMQLMRGEIKTYSMDKRYFHKTGRIIWVKLTVSLVRTASGTPDHFVAVVEDITQLKQTEAALRQSENRYREIVEAQDDAICRFRPDYCVTFANQFYAQLLFGKHPDEIIGRNLLDYIPSQFSQQFIALNASLNAESLSMRSEIPITADDGSMRWVEFNNRVILDEAGRPMEYQVVGRDTTARKQVESAEREQRRLAEALRDSLLALTASRDEATVMQQILNYALTVVPADGAYILLFEDGQAKIAYSHGYHEDDAKRIGQTRFSLNEPIYREMISTQQPYLIPEIDETSDWVRFPTERTIHAALGVPIVIRGEVIGALNVNSATPGHFRPPDIAKLQDFARYASLALENAYHVSRLEQRVRERTAEIETYAAEVHDLYNNAPCGYHSLDKNGYFVNINDTELEWLGYSREEVIGVLKYSDLCTPEGIKDFQVNFPLFKERGWVRHVEHDLICKDGRVMRVLLNATAIYDQDGNYLRGRSTLYDITALNDAQEKVRQQRDLLQLIINTVPTAIVLKGEDGRYEMVNDRSAKIYEMAPEQMIGKNDNEVHPNADEVAVFAEQDRFVRETGLPIFVPDGGFGGYHFQTSVIPLKTAAGKVNRILIVSNDITERKKIEMALSEQRDFLNLIINSVPDLIAVKDQMGCYQMVNDQTAKVHGLRPTQMLGKTDHDVNPNREEVEFSHRKDREALESGNVVYIAEQNIFDRQYQTTKIPLRNAAGKFDRLLVVASDITEHKQAQAVLQQALLKEKELGDLRSRFISMTSHEFRTPLTAILATAETLGTYRQKLNEEQIDKRLLKIQEQVNYLKDIMEDVLQLSTLQAQRAEVTRVEFDFDLLCQQLIDELRSEFMAPHQILYSCDSALCSVFLDKKLMRQVITNLLSNAVKYSPSGKPITILATKSDESLVLRISDQGIGIPESDLKHLFEPFHRAANVGTIQGTGLGLTIAKESIESHGGTLAVESVVGAGTTFIVQIPL